MELELRGRVALITGGASGIGWACAQGFAREGSSVALWDLSEDVSDKAASLSSDFGIAAIGRKVDVSDGASVQTAALETEAAAGPVSCLVHSAATGSGKFGFPFTNLTPADWPRVLEVNVMGMVHVAHAVAPGMVTRQSGSMVFIASVSGQIGSQTDPPYSASKAANINFAQCLAKDLAPHNVRANIVNPGMIRTPLNRRVWQSWNQLQTKDRQRTYEEWGADKVRSVVPLGRWQSAEDVADMVVFLSSARASQITGQTINVDGGQVMHW